jgi:hypothetical protein
LSKREWPTCLPEFSAPPAVTDHHGTDPVEGSDRFLMVGGSYAVQAGKAFHSVFS